ncbi:hypothetical protein ABZ791_16710 [Streptomyces huasconensis]|uniref:Uncharacterized protein n=1 Tax=Streptomyces huasconensis TaxID=1854574 RepID=A0ABV3LMZ7_9ACTN
MSDVVDSDELLRRIRRARDWAHQEETRYRARSADGETETPDGAPDADVLASVYEAVRKVLDEVVDPGTNAFD